MTSVQLAGSPEPVKLTSVFGESIDDITQALVDVLTVMEKRLKPGGMDFPRAHSAPEVRIKVVEKEIGSTPWEPVDQMRERCFEAALGKI